MRNAVFYDCMAGADMSNPAQSRSNAFPRAAM
jgi:hypothetical protein